MHSRGNRRPGAAHGDNFLASASAGCLGDEYLYGCIIAFGRVNPVIATLAALAVFLARGVLIGIPVLILVLVVVAVLAHVVLRYTSIGRNIYAVGGNNIASRLGGININRYIIGVYMVTPAPSPRSREF